MSGRDSVLITGATGFIGTALCRRLTNLGIEAICPVRAGSRRGATLATLRGVRTFSLDSRDTNAWAALLPPAGVDAVFNLAAYGVHPQDRDPDSLVEGNVGLLARLLTALRHRPPRRVVHVGSCSEYAPTKRARPIDENWPLAPTTPYGAAKAAAHHLGHALARQFGIPIATLRLFGVFGPGEGAWRLLPSLISGLTRELPVDLSPGEQVRDMLHVDDVVEALISASRADLPGCVSYNLCSGRGITVGDIARSTASALGEPESLLRFGALPYRDGETMYVVGDPGRFKSATHWVPRFTVEQGIADMIERSGESVALSRRLRHTPPPRASN